MKPGRIIIQNTEKWDWDLPRTPWLEFRDPVDLIEVTDVGRVRAALERIDTEAQAGSWAAGFMAYEAAPAFDPAFEVRPPSDLPLVWFGIFAAPRPLIELPPAGSETYRLSPWQAEMDQPTYDRHIARIRELIADGETYQVNFTFPMIARFDGDAWRLFHDLHQAQRGGHGAFVLTTRHAILSLSPELFFAQSGAELTVRPMKGTAPRGRWLAEDEHLAVALQACPKNRAENLMIVDLLRNDLGRVAVPGTVRAEPLFEIERYETVLQMTSTVHARTDAHPTEVLAALFPSGSVTGAPKVRTMQIIAGEETTPRGVYTGAIGWIGPDRRACFNVAIRTLQIDLDRGQVVYGVGGGVTWDSSAEGEYEECRTKTRLLDTIRPEFDLLETMLWEPNDGYFLLERHLARLAESACYFRFQIDLEEIHRRLATLAETFQRRPQRVRLLLSQSGGIRLQVQPIQQPSGPMAPMRVGLAAEPVDARDPFLFHKTTHRAVYERARRNRPGLDDVILWNQRGELTESTTANLVVDLDGGRWTSPRDCGLLAGVMRAELLERGEIGERIIHKDELSRASALWLINSVRRVLPVRLIRSGARSQTAIDGFP